MSDESKRILAFLLCGIIMIVWMASGSKPSTNRKEALPNAASASNLVGGTKPDIGSGDSAAMATKGVASKSSAGSAAKRLTPLTPQRFTLESDKLTLELSNQGGHLNFAELKDYHRQLTKNGVRSTPVRLTLANDVSLGNLRWDFTINNKPLIDLAVTKAKSEGQAVLFTLQSASYPQLEVQRRYELPASGYLVHASTELKNLSNETLLVQTRAGVGVEVGTMELGNFNGNDKDVLEAAAWVGDKRHHAEIRKGKGESLPGNVTWAGMMDRYFMATLLPPAGSAVEGVQFESTLGDQLVLQDASGNVVAQSRLHRWLTSDKLELTEKIGEAAQGAARLVFYQALTGQPKWELPMEQVQLRGKQLQLMPAALEGLAKAQLVAQRGWVQMSYATRSVAAGQSSLFDCDLYLGPKDFEITAALNRKLESSIDLGDWIGPIARPMRHFLKWSYSWLPNYGLGIILLTVLVRLLLYPLTHIQFKSMQRMQSIKPQMDQLREKYKDQREELNKHMLDLFRTNRVNPMGGCLPLILQMPVFFALYRVLYNAIELRHAPFFLWLQDLSVQDPYYVTPILLGGAMFLQQKMTPTTGMDPSQETMMKVMPLMFSFFMIPLPSGLVLYILVSTLLGLAQQWKTTQVMKSTSKS